MSRGVIFGERAADEIVATVRRSRGMRQRRGNGAASRAAIRREFRFATLASGITAPASCLAPTENTVARLRWKVSTGGLIITADRPTVWNFDKGVSTSDVGHYGVAQLIDGVWEIISLSCDPFSELEGIV